MKSHAYVLADVFTNRPLAGNQLAVFTDADKIVESRLQAIAKEMNLAETMFVFASKQADASVRYFTSVREIAFAGGPTLGVACIIANEQLDDGESRELTIDTPKGRVSVDVRRESSVLVSSMVQPTPIITPWGKTDELVEILGVSKPLVPVEVYDNGNPHLFVVLEDAAEVAGIVPDMEALRQLSQGPLINVLAGSGNKYITRTFAIFDPAVPEDPACGGAAGPLSAHLVRHGLVESGVEITLSQGEFVGRPSTLYAAAEVDEAGNIESVRVAGSTVIVGRGELYPEM